MVAVLLAGCAVHQRSWFRADAVKIDEAEPGTERVAMRSMLEVRASYREDSACVPGAG